MITASDHAGQVEMRVIDHGPGIPDDQRDQVFLPFQRLGDRDNATGVGLGLALSRGLAEAMGGTLTPETTPGGGLTMTLTLPAAARRRPPSPDWPSRSAADRAIVDACRRRHRDLTERAVTRILVVDDEPQILRALRINLRARQYDVDIAADGAAALRSRRRASRPTWSCSTSACPTWTASRSSAGCAAGPPMPIIVLSGRAGSARQGRTPSTPAPTTTSPSRSASTSCSPASAPSPAAAARRRRPADGPRSAGTPSTSPTAPSRRRRRTRGAALTPTEWQLLGDPGPQPRQAGQPAPAAARGLGTAATSDETHYLRQYMAQLRRKLEDDPAHPRHLLTEPGMGYRFQIQPDPVLTPPNSSM